PGPLVTSGTKSHLTVPPRRDRATGGSVTQGGVIDHRRHSRPRGRRAPYSAHRTAPGLPKSPGGRCRWLRGPSLHGPLLVVVLEGVPDSAHRLRRRDGGIERRGARG